MSLTTYYTIHWMNAANNHKTEIKTMLNVKDLIQWASENLSNWSTIGEEAIRMSNHPTKYKSVNHPDVHYWAEPNDLDFGKSFCVIVQADNYPATEGWGDWFGTFEGADDTARRLAAGEDLWALQQVSYDYPTEK